jgi:hypothetical protein
MVSIALTRAETEALTELNPDVVVCPPGDEAHVTRWRDEQGYTPGRWLVVPTQRVDDVVGAVDCGEGHDLLLVGGTWEFAKHGVFHNDGQWVYLSDYHGYPGGALFRRA